MAGPAAFSPLQFDRPPRAPLNGSVQIGEREICARHDLRASVHRRIGRAHVQLIRSAGHLCRCRGGKSGEPAAHPSIGVAGASGSRTQNGCQLGNTIASAPTRRRGHPVGVSVRKAIIQRKCEMGARGMNSRRTFLDLPSASPSLEQQDKQPSSNGRGAFKHPDPESPRNGSGNASVRANKPGSQAQALCPS